MDRPKNEKAIQFLFLIDALKRSRKGKNESKNVEVLRRDIENAWQERFPDIPMTPISAATMVQPNEGFYRWLMGNSNYVMVVEPAMVRNRLKSRLAKALSAIRQYERSDDKDPIDYDALKMKKQNDDFQEMWRDMFLIPSMD